MGDATEVTKPMKDDDDIPSVITHDSVELNFNANNSKDNEIEINEKGGSQMEEGDQPGNILSVSSDLDGIGIDVTNTVPSCVSTDVRTPSAPPALQNMEITNDVFDVEIKRDVALMDTATTEVKPEVSARQIVLDPCETPAPSNVQIPDAFDSHGIESIEILQSETCVTESSQTQPTSSYNWGSDQMNDPFAQVTMEQIMDTSAVSNSDEPADVVEKPQITGDIFSAPNVDFGHNSITLFGVEQKNEQTNATPVVQSTSPDKTIEAPITADSNAVNFVGITVEMLPKMNTVDQNSAFEQAPASSFVESVGTKSSSSYNWGSDQTNDPFAQVAVEHKSAVSNSDEPADVVEKPQITGDIFSGPNVDFGHNSITLFGVEQKNEQTNATPVVQSTSPDKTTIEAPITAYSNAVNFVGITVEMLPKMNTVDQNREFAQAPTSSFVESVGPKPSSSYNWGSHQGFDPFAEIAAGFTM